MTIVRSKDIGPVGAIGVNKDLSTHELPLNAWTDCRNIRFLDGYALQYYGHGEVYNSPSVTPQYIMPVNIAGARYWIYTSAAKTYCVNLAGGVVTHTDITHVTPRTGVINQWTGTTLGGIPILNSGDATNIPMYWDMDVAHKFVDLTNWPAATYCKSLRSFKNIIIGMGVTTGGTSYPMRIMFSHPADPGTLPTTYDATDATKDAGNFDISDGSDAIIDGLPLKESFIVYKESSTWRLDYVGGTFVLSDKKVFGMSGIMNRNCAVEFDGWHFVVTNSDVAIHDGYTAQSVLDKTTRRYFFQNIDTSYAGSVFVFKNPFFNEIFVCYPSVGATSCDKAIVYNYVDKTISFRDLPNLNHASYGPISNGLSDTFDSDPAPFDSDLTTFDGPDYVPNNARVLMASADMKLFLLDSSASFNGAIPVAYLERRGLSFDAPELRKLVKQLRLRISGNAGESVIVKVGYANTPYADPVYTTMTYIIGTTQTCDCLVEGAFIALRLETGTAYQWKLDSYDIEIVTTGEVY